MVSHISNILRTALIGLVAVSAGAPAANARQPVELALEKQTNPLEDKLQRPTTQGELNIQRAFAEFLETNIRPLGMIQDNRDFSGQALTQTDFTGFSLRNARFDGAQLDWANFTGADLTGASFVGANLGSATFTGANLTNANFSDSNMNYTHIDGANLTGARLSRVENIATVVMSETTIFCRTIGFNDEVFSYSCPE